MTLSQYQYEELSCESSFRLFRFEKSQPCSAVRADEISIQLFEASFEHSPEFEAVSYAWGQDPPSSFITCNGKQLHVTPNVEAILRILCVQTISVGIFWIDSICINQTNISEKNVQVPRMRSIYSEATRVWIWLGEGTHETKTAFSFILQVAGSSNWDSEYTRDTVRLAELHECFKDKVRNTRGYYDAVDTNFLIDLLNLPWFQRTWPIQELVLAKQAILICGSLLCPWLRLMKVLTDVQLNETLYPSTTTTRSNPAAYLAETECYTTLIASLHATGHRPSISEILKATRSRLSSVPEDKVFGLYGIFSHMRLEGLPKVDYDRAVHITYTEFTTAAIRMDNTLDILHQVCLPNIVSSLPSWVPDYSNASFFRPIHVGKSFASNSSVAWYSISGSQLSVRGLFVDRIREVAISTSIATASFRRGFTARLDARESEFQRIGVLELVRTLQAWVGLSQNVRAYPTGISALDALHRILLQNPDDKHQELLAIGINTVPTSRAWEQWMDIITANFLDDPIAFETLHEEIRGLPDYNATLTDYSHLFGYGMEIENWPNELKIRFILRLHSKMVAWLQHEIFLNTYHKTFLITRDGYMGTCPRWAEASDLVVLIAGLKLPFIVRRAGEHYKLIGPAYIEGIMKGERWEESDAITITFI